MLLAQMRAWAALLSIIGGTTMYCQLTGAVCSSEEDNCNGCGYLPIVKTGVLTRAVTTWFGLQVEYGCVTLNIHIDDPEKALNLRDAFKETGDLDLLLR